VWLKFIIAGASQDVLERYGDVRDEKFFMDLFRDPPALCGQTCAFLASGRGKELRGLYLGTFLRTIPALAFINAKQIADKMYQSCSSKAVRNC
jgi:hypothetical protein